MRMLIAHAGGHIFGGQCCSATSPIYNRVLWNRWKHCTRTSLYLYERYKHDEPGKEHFVSCYFVLPELVQRCLYAHERASLNEAERLAKCGLSLRIQFYRVKYQPKDTTDESWTLLHEVANEDTSYGKVRGQEFARNFESTHLCIIAKIDRFPSPNVSGKNTNAWISMTLVLNPENIWTLNVECTRAEYTYIFHMESLNIDI